MELIYSTPEMKSILKESGNRFFKKQDYFEAIGLYSKGLQIDPIDINLLSNRSQAYIKYNVPRLALQDAENALKIDPTHQKCIHRKTTALWGLRRYDEALEFLNSLHPGISKSFMESQVFTDLMQKAQEFVKQSRGEYDMEIMLDLAEDKIHDFAEFTGPIEIAEIPGKGRGFIAKTDIPAGQLLMCSKAFAIHIGYDEKEDTYFDKVSVDILVQNICERLALDPECCKEFSRLYGEGPVELENRTPWIWKNTDDEDLERKNVNEVASRVYNNSFCGTGSPNFTGIWIEPCYFNHSCIDNNAHWVFYGDIMLIRASKPIKKGEEVTIYYFASQDSSRVEAIENQHKFRCTCRLCEFEREESLTTKEAVQIMIDLINRDLETPVCDKDIMLTRIKWVMSLRAENPALNLALLDPCIEAVALKLYANMRFQDVADILNAVRNVSDNNCNVVHAVQLDMTISSCFLYLEKRNEILKWIKMLKQDLIVAYGCKIIVRKIGLSIVEELEEAGFGGMELFHD